MTDYEQLLNAVEQYYGSGSDQWAEIAKYGIASDKAESILSQVPGVNVIKNANGKIRSYNFAPTENIASDAINSNTPAVIKSFEVPANTGLETVTTPAGETVEQMTFKSGMSQAGNFVFGEVVPAIAAAGVGITLGKKFDKLLYNWDPDFWDEKGLSTLNSDVWGDIIGTDDVGARVLNMILGTTPDFRTQAYIDQNALAYMALYAKNKGVFNAEENTFTNENLDEFDINSYKCKFVTNFTLEPVALNYRYNGNLNGRYLYLSEKEDTVYIYSSYSSKYPKYVYHYMVSKKPFKVNEEDGRIRNAVHLITDLGVSIYTFSQESLVDLDNAKYKYTVGTHVLDVTINGVTNPYNIGYGSNLTNISAVPSAALLYGNGIVKTIGGVDGIGTQDGAKTPDLSNAGTVEDVLNALKEQYPEIFNNAVTQDVVQPDGSTITYNYVPIAIPETDVNGNPVSSPSTQANPKVDPATATEPLLKLTTKLIQKDPPLNPPDTGSGDAPAVVPTAGSASALYAIYNPTLAQINSFGAWLWSDNFVDQIKKLFNDPMQAIIGLHKVYATPATSGAQNIKVGYLDSGVSANVVSNQYTTIDCGTVTLSEYFHNVFDYSPYTQINLYLPFIGIVSLDNADVMRASIHIVYHVDVLSGACLAEVKVTRDSAGGTLYQYAGNASVTLPISSGSYMGIVTSIASIAGGIAGTIASGGAALPMLASAAGSALNARAKVEHSGSFSGNAGAMGGKIPYLIISRPQVALADNFQKYIGFPANYTTKLSNCTGFVKVLECHIENVNATNSELTEIESLLKGGIIV